jgi:L-2-hydroxyglutarate oxidase LhgO
VDGHTKIGPTAIPAFWREQYNGFDRFNAAELMGILFRQAGLFLTAGFDFRRLAMEEIQKYSRKRMVQLSQVLAEGIRLEDFRRWGRPGIRAQLLHLKEKKLEMDFVIQGDKKSLHVLNVVSPGFTCSIPFSEYVVERIEEYRR